MKIKDKIMRLSLFMLFIISELILIIGLLSFPGIDRYSSVESYHQWKWKPSQETKAEWEKQSYVLRGKNFILEMILLSLLIVNTLILVAFIVHVIKFKKEKRIPGST